MVVAERPGSGRLSTTAAVSWWWSLLSSSTWRRSQGPGSRTWVPARRRFGFFDTVEDVHEIAVRDERREVVGDVHGDPDASM